MTDLKEFSSYAAQMMQLIQDNDRKDVEFRFLIAGSQLRRISENAYIGRDNNPTKEEMASLGHAFVQMFVCTQLRGMEVLDAIEASEDENVQDQTENILKLSAAFFEALAFVHHDKRLSPSARPYKTPEQEKIIHGRFYRLLSNLCRLRGVDPNECVQLALRALEEGEWRSRIGGRQLEGITTHSKNFEGIAFVDPYLERLGAMQGGILVTSHPNENLTHYLDHIDGIVTDQGGLLCHAALIAREFGKPYLVGTGDATSKIKNGQRIRIFVSSGKGKIQILD